MPEQNAGPFVESPADPESTAALLFRVRSGDASARDRLVRRYLEPLTRWARGRLPVAARDLADTADLVQVTLVRALNRVQEFEPRHEGAFLAYLRRILLNEIRAEMRKAFRRPGRSDLPDDLPEGRASPLEEVIGRQALEGYERGLAALSAEEREGIIMRLELGFTHQQVAEALGRPSADAARMLVARALVRLTEAMDGTC
jgi:RNA polymerase sigma-70 factor (ECF subfamily)